MSTKPRILVVDDKRNMVRLMAKVLRDEATVLTAHDGGSALRVLASEPVDVILCDLKMPDMDGLDVLRASQRLCPHTEFVLMTAFATVGTAVEALKLGAFDYISKPFEPDAAKAVLLRALARVPLRADSDRNARAEVLPGVIARSAVMESLAELVRKVADSDTTALVLGETGTGRNASRTRSTS